MPHGAIDLMVGTKYVPDPDIRPWPSSIGQSLETGTVYSLENEGDTLVVRYRARIS